MKIHFIGIGGIGVSALARYYLLKGHKISGSDLVSSEITEYFRKKGIKIFIGKHKAKSISKDIDLVVYSPAVTPDKPDRKEAQRLGLKIKSYPEALGELTKKNFTIAVCGSHGKSTTTAMIGVLLTKAKLDPTVIVGTKLKEFGDSNCRVGKSKYLVIEADEHFGSFLNYQPNIVIFLSLEEDHLDYYKNLKNLIKTFRKFILKLPKDGILIANKDDANVAEVLMEKKLRYKTIYYSLKDKEAKKIKKVLKLPGAYNVSNALASLKVAQVLGVPDKVSYKALSKYGCSWRRFEISKIKVNKKKITLIDDYGHHSTQAKLTLEATREKFPKKEIWCVYQPHQYQRTYYLFDNFVKAFKWAPVDRIIITDIYEVTGREEKEISKKINSQRLVEAINKNSVTYMAKEKLERFLKKNLKSNQVLIIMGAGDIYDLSLKLKK